jgi:thiol-disulfide isomerase/thioredoxin
MKKITLCFSFLFICSVNLYSQVTFTGTIYNSPDQTVYLMNLYGKKIDSATIGPVSPHFTLKAADVTAETFLNMFYQKKGPFILNQFVVLPGEHIVFSCDLSSPDRFKWITVTGSRFTAERIAAFRSATPFKAKIEKNRIQIDSIRNDGGDTSEIADKQQQIINDEKQANLIYQQVFDTTKSARNASQMLSLLRSSFLISDTKKDSLLRVLQLRFPDDKSIQLLHNAPQQDDEEEGLEINTKAPNIVLQDINGQAIELNKAHFKYLLIDFWASWCKPCRLESPYLLRTFNAFKDKDFKVLAVSIDGDAAKWKEAISTDGTMSFIHVDDPNAGKSIYLKLYKLNSIPYNFIIDGKGNIIAKNLRGDDLYKEVTKLMAGN